MFVGLIAASPAGQSARSVGHPERHRRSERHTGPDRDVQAQRYLPTNAVQVRTTGTDGRLLVSALANQGYSLLSVDTKGGVSLLWQTKGSARHPGDVFRSGSLAPRALSSPHGRHVAIQTSSVTSNIWMIENF